jgi:hypothetical protein
LLVLLNKNSLRYRNTLYLWFFFFNVKMNLEYRYWAQIKFFSLINYRRYIFENWLAVLIWKF